MAKKEFDAFLTTDKGIPHQQNLADFDLAVGLLWAKSNDYANLAPLIGEAVSALASATPGTVVRVPCEASG